MCGEEPVDPAHLGRDAAQEAAADLADTEEDAVQAHDRAAVGRVRLGHVGKQTEGCRRRAGEDEGAASTASPNSSWSGTGRPWLWLTQSRRRPTIAPPPIP